MKFIIIDDDEDTYFSYSIEYNFCRLLLNKLNGVRYFFIKMIFDLDTIDFKNKLKFLNNLLNIGNIIVDEENDEICYYVGKGSQCNIFSYKFNEEQFYDIPNIDKFSKYSILISSSNFYFGRDFTYKIKHKFINDLFHYVVLNKHGYDNNDNVNDNNNDDSDNHYCDKNANFVIWKFALLYDIGNKLIESNLKCEIPPVYEYYEQIYRELFTKQYHNHDQFDNNADYISYYLCYH